MVFKENLKRFRIIKDDTVDVIASAIGVSMETYLSWEAGEKEPEYNELCSLANYFMVTTDILLMNAAFDYSKYLSLAKAKGLLD